MFKSSDFSYRLARIISLVFNPILLAVVALPLITDRYSPNRLDFWRWTIVAIVLVVGPSIIYVLYHWIAQRRIDVDISRREDRIVPLLFSTLGALIGGYLVSARLNIPALTIISYVLAASLIALTIITFVWKVSIHTTTLAVLITLLVVFRGWVFAPLFLVVVLVGWARYTLRRHTPAQLIGGVLLGIGITALIGWVFRA